MATTTEVISTLQSRGVTLKADGTGGLRVTGISRLSEHERATLKAHKPAILKALAASLDNQTTTISPSPVAPPARECGNCANFEKYPYEPLGSCHTRRKMQHATSKPRRFGCSDFKLAAGQQESSHD